MPISMPLSDVMPDKRRAYRSPPNPLDKSTIISIYPNKIEIQKHTIFPGKFIIEPGTYEKPSILVIGQSSWFRDRDPNLPIEEVVCGSMEVANAIVNDHISALVTWSGDAKPGLFFIPGEKDLLSVKKDHKDLLDNAKIRQNRWYESLIKMADAMWSMSNSNPRTISEEMRLAAQELNISEKKEWMGDFNTREMTNCPACGFLRHGNFPVCQNCHTIIDKKEFEARGLSQQLVK